MSHQIDDITTRIVLWMMHAKHLLIGKFDNNIKNLGVKRIVVIMISAYECDVAIQSVNKISSLLLLLKYEVSQEDNDISFGDTTVPVLN